MMYLVKALQTGLGYIIGFLWGIADSVYWIVWTPVRDFFKGLGK